MRSGGTKISGIDTGRIGPRFGAGPSEQQTGDLDPPFRDGGRRADLPGDHQQRECADQDYNDILKWNARRDKEAIGQMKAADGTPWVKGRKTDMAGEL